MVDVVLEDVELETHTLLSLCQQLKLENSNLMQRQTELIAQNQILARTNYTVQEKLQALLGKLKIVALQNEHAS